MFKAAESTVVFRCTIQMVLHFVTSFFSARCQARYVAQIHSNFVLCRGVRLSSFDDFLYKAESASHEPFCARNGNPRQVTQISNWREHKNTVGISYFVC